MSSNAILLLEDNALLCRLYSKVLHYRGFSVEVATSIPYARMLLHKQYFALFICDVRISNETTLPLLLEKQNQLKQTQIVLVSAEKMPPEYQSVEIATFLLKPFPPETLVTLAQELLVSRSPDGYNP